jgi:hypothetical protein
MAEISRETMISTSYGPRSGGGYYRRRPGAPLVPLEQVLNEETGFDGNSYDLAGGGRPDWRSIDGSQPKTDSAKMVAALKTRGLPTPTLEQVKALLVILNPDDPNFDEDLDKTFGIARTEQKVLSNTVKTDDPLTKAAKTIRAIRMNRSQQVTFKQMMGTIVGATVFFLVMDWFIQKSETRERRSRAA